MIEIGLKALLPYRSGNVGALQWAKKKNNSETDEENEWNSD